MTKVPDGGITSPRGFHAAGYTAGFKASGAPDLALVVTDDHVPVPTAAVFTTNLVRAAPVILSDVHMRRSGGRVSGILLNAGQANAATGDTGYKDAEETASLTASSLGVSPEHVLICSTGVIGHRIDMSKMRAAIPSIVSQASSSTMSGHDAANAILTTDLVCKTAAFRTVIDGHEVTIGGMCKGSGMIHPSMATMLAVLTCDASVPSDLWHVMLSRAVDRSFNAITVDGDTSTNDVVSAMAGGRSGLTVTSASEDAAKQLEGLLQYTCQYLAKSVARDGEGATVLLEIQVSGAQSDDDAMRIAKTVASSSLVKAAVFGRDPNWGRIAAAAGRAGAPFEQTALNISIGEHALMLNGKPLDTHSKAASQYMTDKAGAAKEDYLSEKDTVVISVGVGDGPGSATAWGCDLSYKYVEINAEYRT